MRDRQCREAVRILARNAVRSEVEWQALTRLAIDTADNVLSRSERDHVERLLGAYRPR